MILTMGSTNVSFPTFFCIQEREYQTLVAFLSWKRRRQKTFFQNYIYLPSVQWKLGAILKPPDWSPRIVEESEDLVKTSWISKTRWQLEENPGWFSIPDGFKKNTWEPGEFNRFSPKKTKKPFAPSNTQKKTIFRFSWCFFSGFGETWVDLNLVKFQDLVKTWWNSKNWWNALEILMLFQNLVNFQNLVKGLVNVQKLGEHLVISKTWCMCKTGWKLGEC